MKPVSDPARKNTSKIGNLGEDVAAQYLKNVGFNLLERNYRQKFGEIDIIAQKNTLVHFVEVKTVTHETKQQLEWAVTHETWRPEEQVHNFKIHQIEKTLEAWISEHQYQGDWQIDVLAIRVVPRETYASVNYIPNVGKV